MKPPNFTDHPSGYNRRMFSSERAVRRGFMMLGYGINTRLHEVPKSTVRKFQRDYNKCADRFGQWGKVDENGDLDKPTLNALEHGIRWSKKRENKEGIPTARSWQSLCRDATSDSCGECGEDGRAKIPKRKESSRFDNQYIEVTPQGIAKLRSIDTDIALRAEVIDFERDGNVVFAIVKIPPQADLPGGRDKPFRCPCVLGR